MKQFAHILSLIALLFMAAVPAHGETYYVLNEASEVEIQTSRSKSTPKTYTLGGPGAVLTFDLYFSASSRGDTEVYAIDASGNETKIGTFNNGYQAFQSSTKSYTADIPSTQITKIRFQVKSGATVTKKIKNVKVTRATTLSTSSSAITFGNVPLTQARSQTVNITYSNTNSGQTLTAQCSNSAFALSATSWAMADQGTIALMVNFCEQNSLGQKSGTVTLKRGSETVGTISLSANVTGPIPMLMLIPTAAPHIPYPGETYTQVTLQRVLPAGYSTLALPFASMANEIADGAMVAQLAYVTFNDADGYTLFFAQVAGGAMEANQPYLLQLPQAVSNPTWANKTVGNAEAGSVSTAELQDWCMNACYQPLTTMEGKYGLSGGKLCIGAAGSSLNAYQAYFEPPIAPRQAPTRVAIVDSEGKATYIGEIADGLLVPSQVFSLDGVRQKTEQRGINLVQMPNGSVRKVWKR